MEDGRANHPGNCRAGEIVCLNCYDVILIKNRKTHLQDEKGEPLGAAWYDEWIAPDGKVVRKSKPIPMSEMEKAP